MPANWIRFVYGESWAICPRWLQSAMADYAAESPRRTTRLPKVNGNVAILPLHGVISQRASIWQQMFGGTSTQAFGAAYSRAVNDDRIKAVVFDVDSPGGTTAGVRELSDLIWQGQQIKDTVAVANSQAASAAYWLASQVGPKRFFAAPGSDVGSIGVFRMHEDFSGRLEQDGIKVEFLAHPEYKVEGNPYQPLSDDAREHHMEQVRATYGEFVADVARGRDVAAGTVEDAYGRGRMFHAAQAADMGMVDGVRTLPQVLAGLGAQTGGSATDQVASGTIEQELCQAWESGEIVPFKIPTSLEIRKRRLFVLTN